MPRVKCSKLLPLRWFRVRDIRSKHIIDEFQSGLESGSFCHSKIHTWNLDFKNVLNFLIEAVLCGEATENPTFIPYVGKWNIDILSNDQPKGNGLQLCAAFRRTMKRKIYSVLSAAGAIYKSQIYLAQKQCLRKYVLWQATYFQSRVEAYCLIILTFKYFCRNLL